MKLRSLMLTVLLTVAVSYYVYTPLPAGLQEQWKLMALDAGFRTTIHLATVSHWLGLDHYITSIRKSIEGFEGLTKALVSSESSGGVIPGVKVSDITFSGVPVRVYEPPAGGEGHLRRGLMFFHGGGWALGSGKKGTYDTINRIVSDELNTVVVSVDYRLFPEVHFPAPYLDCLSAAKHFLSSNVLRKFSVDPERVAVSGDSAGGNLAAAVAQEIATDDSVLVKFSVQALIYPPLQAVDFHTPSYVQNQNVPILPRPLMVQFWLQYLHADPALLPQLLANNHSTPELRSRLDWTAFLPPRYQQDHPRPPVAPPHSAPSLLKAIPALLDVRAAPLLAAPQVLAKCPRAYVLTCEYDVLRDDGLMYARRLKEAGVAVTSDHLENGFHGCFSFISWPLEFSVGHEAVRHYVSWLQNNL
ncbi:neutral cholesterol ester hydrolase 1a [Gouania willdenowi]|uniref:Neutral cholesterol ester hydrolase 1-like n=1 Tax=Gouania willdenowi TaxID=441366 RepID=A0A8C5NBG4_GOUWI|nr:neutral cholesterol ester hydrolase 1-like [Gouania willdenowi]